MASTLSKIPFTKDLLSEVADFECGGKPYETEVSDWIKTDGPESALEAMQKFGTKVWLYVEEGNIVGFGSLGVSNWNWPEPTTKPRVRVNLIPMVGIQSRYHGKPDGPTEQRFSTQIMLDLIDEARRNTDAKPVLGLFVHPDNAAAIRFYRRIGFQDFHQRSGGYVGMILRLD
jgi:GNAT superfamily N-acetyltransferase